MCKDKDCKLSICCLTYNHAPYIRECLDGFLMQKTDFPIEIIIHDDASTDNTQDILREYKAKYPDLFHLILQTENQYSKGVNVAIEYIFSQVRGKYIAFCEGDDYWIDPLKLQREVDFLETHPNYSICCHWTDRYVQNEKRIWKYMPPVKIEDDGITFTLLDWINWGNFFQTSSVVVRRNNIDMSFLNSFERSLDVHLFYSALENGRGYFLKNTMSVYRIHTQGCWSGLNKEEQKIRSFFDVYEIYQKKKNKYTKRWLTAILGELILFYIRKDNSPIKAVKLLPMAIKYCGCNSVLYISRYVGNKILNRYFK